MMAVPILVLGLLVAISAVAGPRIAERPWGLVGTFVLSPFHPATWRSIASILLGFVVVTIAVMVIISGFSTGTSLLVIGIGVVLVGITVEISRAVARVERWRARIADPRPLLPHPYRPYGRGPRELVLAVFADYARWLDVAYVFIAFPLVVLELVAIVVLWALALALVSTPFWLLGDPPLIDVVTRPFSREGTAVTALLLGLALIPVAAWSSQMLMALHRAVVAGVLCESERRLLQRRVEALEGSRQAVIAAEATELRRIERDLHDGAQQRLVALTMDLGLAAERIETDPAAARGLVLEAQDQARQALAEIRDLVRGIAPPILVDRGLVPALAAVAARSPVTTTVVSDLPEGTRLPEATERAAYFVVAEALANVTKHAGATRCEIRLRLGPNGLAVEVEDDGTGGAVVAPTGGLAGLQGRVQALDGRFEVHSPAGGPTVVRAILPVVATRIAQDAAPTAIPGWRGPQPPP